MSQRLPNIRFVGLGVATACELLLSALTPLHPTRAAAQESPARLLAAYALALRNADVAGDDSAAAILANMPEAGMASVGESLPALLRSQNCLPSRPANSGGCTPRARIRSRIWQTSLRCRARRSTERSSEHRNEFGGAFS